MASKSKPFTNWLDLPVDVMIDILRRISHFDILTSVQKVCTTWHKICKEPALWRVIHINYFQYSDEVPFLRKICELSLDRSQGQLVDLTIVEFVDDDLLQYAADRSSQLRRLEFAYCSSRGWIEALKKFPLLEELNLYSTNISKEAIETAGRYCPMLKTLKVNQAGCWRISQSVRESVTIDNEIAKAIGQNLSKLGHLQLIGFIMSKVGMLNILDGCCHLESLDLRNYLRIIVDKELRKRCSEHIKYLKLRNNFHQDYRFYYALRKEL